MFQEGLTAVTFNAAFYLEANADLQTAFGNLSGDALDARLLQHFIEFGQFEGRDPNEFFDTSYYLAENGDVLAAIGNPANTAVTSAFQHFVTFGAAEGIVRAPSAPFESFNAETYFASNPDLQAAFASVPAAQLPNVLFQHFVTFGVNEDRPGTGLDEGSQLAAQLEALAAANADVADALEGAARLINAAQDEPLEGDDLDAVIDGFDEADLVAAVSGATTNAQNAQTTANAAATTLSNARLAQSDAAINSELTAARAAVRADATANGLVVARENAEAALARDVATDGSDAEVLAGIRDAIGTFVASGGDLSTGLLRGTTPVTDGVDPITVGSLLARINEALATGNADAETDIAGILEDLGGAGSLSLATNTASTASATALTGELNVADERADLIAAVDTAEENLDDARDPGSVVDRFLDAEEAVDARATLVEASAEAQADLSDALALLNGLREFQAVVDDRDELLADIEDAFGPIELIDATTETATAESDIFLFDSSLDVESTINGFGDAGDDVLFVGRGFTVVELADDVNILTSAQGNVNALEIFIQQSGADTILFIESESFDGSASNNAFGGSQITLAGVNAEDVVVDANGFLRISPEAEALVA